MRCKGGRAGRNPTEEHCPPARLAPPRKFQSPTSGLAMTLEQLNIVLQLVGTLGVIASLIFVGLQVRQNTKAARVQVQENMTRWLHLSCSGIDRSCRGIHPGNCGNA